MSDLLVTLLATRLPRGRRCGTCVAYDPATDDPACGGCLLLIPPWGGCAASDWCTSWSPSDDSGLDLGGVPRFTAERLMIRPLQGDNERNSS